MINHDSISKPPGDLKCAQLAWLPAKPGRGALLSDRCHIDDDPTPV